MISDPDLMGARGRFPALIPLSGGTQRDVGVMQVYPKSCTRRRAGPQVIILMEWARISWSPSVT